MKKKGKLMRYLKYFSYVVRHKWYVFIECCRFGIPWLGIIHDWKKFTPRSFYIYANHFYGNKVEDAQQKRDDTGYYKPHNTGNPAFDVEVWKHCRDHKHHWQYWVKPMDYSGCIALDMPVKYRKEMLADWIGAGKAQGMPNTKKWWKANAHKLQLHDDVRLWIDYKITNVTEMLENVNDIIDIQSSKGNWDYDPYMHGMLNGMLMIKSIITKEDPEFYSAPEIWGCDKKFVAEDSIACRGDDNEKTE